MPLLIDAHENRDVAAANVEGAYLHSEMDDFVLLKITSAEHIRLMCEINPKLRQCIMQEHGTNVVYVTLITRTKTENLSIQVAITIVVGQYKEKRI